MVKVVNFPPRREEVHQERPVGKQLELALAETSRVGWWIFHHEQEIQPNTVEDVIRRERIVCVSDLRRVPFFAGGGRRHRRINRVFGLRHVPVFHTGAAYFENIDQSLPRSIRLEEVRNAFRERKGCWQAVKGMMREGACLLLVDDAAEVMDFAKMTVEAAEKEFFGIQVRLNGSWGRIAKQNFS